MKLLNKLSKSLNMPVWLSLGLLTLCVIFLYGLLSKIKVRMAPVVLRENLEKWARVYGYGSYIVDLILAMSALESGRWTSPVYRLRNNPWGMKWATKRPNSQTHTYFQGVQKEFAYYVNLDDAAHDIFQWMDYNNAPEFWSLSGFVRFLKSKSYFDADISAAEYERRIKGAIL